MKKKAKPKGDPIRRSPQQEDHATVGPEGHWSQDQDDSNYETIHMDGFLPEQELRPYHELPPHLRGIQVNQDPNYERRIDGSIGRRRKTVLDPKKRRSFWSRRGFRYGLIFGGLILIAALIVFLTLVLPKIREDKMKYTPENYPIHYADLIAFYSEANSLDPFLVAAVMRTESDYRPDVVSSAGAIGLMQILPDTGVWLGERIGIQVTENDLYQPVLNIRLGTSFLRYLLDIFDGEVGTAVAAYNAGQGSVGSWLKDTEYSDDARTLKAIPYAETRNYVERVQVRTERYYEVYEGVFPGNVAEAFESEEEAEANVNR